MPFTAPVNPLWSWTTDQLSVPGGSAGSTGAPADGCTSPEAAATAGVSPALAGAAAGGPPGAAGGTGGTGGGVELAAAALESLAAAAACGGVELAAVPLGTLAAAAGGRTRLAVDLRPARYPPPASATAPSAARTHTSQSRPRAVPGGAGIPAGRAEAPASSILAARAWFSAETGIAPGPRSGVPFPSEAPRGSSIRQREYSIRSSAPPDRFARRVHSPAAGRKSPLPAGRTKRFRGSSTLVN